MRWAAVFLLLALAPSAVSAWTTNGVRLTGAPREQQRPVLASDGAGGAFVAWIDYRASGPPLDLGINLYLQHVTASGQIAAGWPQDGLAVAVGPGHQGTWAIIPDGSGGVLIAYGDSNVDQGDVYLQRITATGAVAPGWPSAGVPIAVAPGEQSFAELAGDGTGGAFVCWQDGSEARFVHVLGIGQHAPGWPTTGRLFEPSTGVVGRPLVLATNTGGFLACWGASDDLSQLSSRLLGQRFDSQGIADTAWPAGGVKVCVDRPLFRGPWDVLVSDGAGGFYAAWDDYRDSSPGAYDEIDIYAQHVLANGTLSPGWPVDGLKICVLPGVSQQYPDLCEDGQGGVFIVWVDERAGYAQVFGMHLGPGGNSYPGWPEGGRLLCNTVAFQLEPHVVWDGSDGAYVTWMNFEAAGYRTYVQHLTSSGASAPGWLPNGVPVATTGGDQYEPRIVRDGGTGAIVAWGDSRMQAPSFMDIYAQRFVNDGVVAAQVSLASAEAAPGEVRLRWHVSGETRASVERRAGEGAWEVRVQVEMDGTGYMSHVDREVMPGRYAYRLAFASGTRAGEVSLEVPASFALSLEGARPNPSSGPLWVGFTLPGDARALLELFDLAGRQVAASEVGARGAGRHLVRLDDGALAPGLYWVSLTQGARTLRSRVVIVR